jgi:calpain-15
MNTCDGAINRLADMQRWDMFSDWVDAPENNGQKYTDPSFPKGNGWQRASTMNNGSMKLYPKGKHHTLRPDQDMCQAENVKQGELGDCWLISTISAFCEDSHRCDELTVHHKRAEKGYDMGIAQFNLYNDGKKQRVVVDDYLPTNSHYGTTYPKYMQFSSDLGAFYGLCEKAFAKLFGDYQSL